MKKIIKSGLLLGAGALAMFTYTEMTTPFEYDYNKENGLIEFVVDEEIVTDYDSDWRFADEENYGTTFRVWFEEKEQFYRINIVYIYRISE